MTCSAMRGRSEDFEAVREGSTAVAAEMREHLLVCEGCRLHMAERRRMGEAMAHLREEVAQLQPSPEVEARVMSALASSREKGAAGMVMLRTEPMRRWMASSSLVVATALLVAYLAVMHHAAGILPAAGGRLPVSAGFTAMPYVVPPAPYERTSLIRGKVLLATLMAAGFQVHGGEPGASTLADVLYGEDGRILAIRLVPEPDSLHDTRMD